MPLSCRLESCEVQHGEIECYKDGDSNKLMMCETGLKLELVIQ